MGPKYDIVTVRKDDNEQTFTDYQGNERTSKFRKVGAVWERDGKLSLSFEAPLTQEDIDDCWFNCFARKERGEARPGKKPAAKTTPAKKPTAKVGPAKKPQTEPFDSDDDSLDD